MIKSHRKHEPVGDIPIQSLKLAQKLINFLWVKLFKPLPLLKMRPLVNLAFLLNGKSIDASRLKEDFRLLILGIKEGNQDVVFNPPADQILKSGMTLILMGDVADVNRSAEVL